MAKVWGKKAKNRQVIINTATELFERQGEGRVTYNDIAEEAGMSRTTIFNHFPTIYSLLVAIGEERVDSYIQYYQTSRLRGRERVVSVYNKLLDDICEYPKFYTRLISVSLTSPSILAEVRRFREMVFEDKDIKFSDAEKDEMSIKLGGCFFGLIAHQFMTEKPFDRDEMKTHFAALAKEVL